MKTTRILWLLLVIGFTSNFAFASGSCKNVFHQRGNQALQEKMKELREHFWQVDASIRELNRDAKNEEAWRDLKEALEASHELSIEFSKHAMDKYYTVRAKDKAASEREQFLKDYQKAYDIFIKMIERLQESVQAEYQKREPDISYLNHRVLRIRDFSTRAHYRY